MKILNLNILWKLIIYMMVISILPIFLVGGISYLYSSQAIREQVDHFSKALLVNQEDSLDFQFKQVEALTGHLAGIETVTTSLKLLDNKHDSYDELATKAQIGYTLNRFLNVEGIISIDLYGAEGVSFHVGDTLLEEEQNPELKDKLTKIAQNETSQVVWPGIENNIHKASSIKLVLPAVRDLRELDRVSLEFKSIGTIVINFSVDYIYEKLKSIDLGKGGYMVLVDQENRIIFHPDKLLIGQNYESPISFETLINAEKSLTAEIAGEEYVFNHIQLRSTGWHLLSVVPEKTLSGYATRTSQITLLIVLVCIVIVTVVGLSISRTMVRPIRKITESFKKYEDGKIDLSQTMRVRGTDEISELVQWFNTFLKTSKLRQESEEQLRFAKREAEKANKAKSEFLSSMSHELRTPLNAILGFSQLLKMNVSKNLTEKQLVHVEHIEEGGKHLIKLIDEILDLAKIEQGAFNFSLEKIDSCNLIEESLTFVQAMARDHQVTIIDHTDNLLPVLWTDALRAKQILLNLMTNAIKYNVKGGKVWIENEQVCSDRLRINIRDSGQGIPEELQSGLFQAFSRLGKEAKGIPGTGIGLFLTQKLITNMGGDIGFVSTEGEGSTFWVDFPIAEDETGQSMINCAVQDRGLEISHEELRHMLYVEDNPANLALMEEIISDIPNIEMTSTHTAELGLSISEKQKFDIIILDINLPGMDGIAAVKQLKKSEQNKSVPVIALSADAMASSIERALDAGFDHYFTKPINIIEMFNIISETMQHKSHASMDTGE